MYQVDQIKVVELTDIESIKLKENKDLVRLLTCTPYMINSQRLLVRGHRISYTEAVQGQEMQRARWDFIYQMLFYILLILILILIAWELRRRYLRKKQKHV